MGIANWWAGRATDNLATQFGGSVRSDANHLGIVFYGGKGPAGFGLNYDEHNPTGAFWDSTYIEAIQSGEYSNGSIASGLDTGSIKARFYCHWSGQNSTSPRNAAIQPDSQIDADIVIQDPDANYWTVSYGSGSDTTTTGSTYSATGPSLAFTPGDVLVMCTWLPTDTTISGAAVTAAGITFSTLETPASLTTVTGNDLSCYLHICRVDSGTATVAPTLTFTETASGFSDGLTLFLRCRAYVHSYWRPEIFYVQGSYETAAITDLDFTGTTFTFNIDTQFLADTIYHTSTNWNGRGALRGGDLQMLVIRAKPYTVDWNTPSGWTKYGPYTNGTTASSADHGSTSVTYFVRQWYEGAPQSVVFTTTGTSATIGVPLYHYYRTRFKKYRIQIMSTTNDNDASTTTIGPFGNNESFVINKVWTTIDYQFTSPTDSFTVPGIPYPVWTGFTTAQRDYGGDMYNNSDIAWPGTALGHDLGGGVRPVIATTTGSYGVGHLTTTAGSSGVDSTGQAQFVLVEEDTWKAQINHAPAVAATGVISAAPVEYQITASGAGQSTGAVNALVSLVSSGQPGDLTLAPVLRANSTLAGSVAYDTATTLANGTGTRSWTHTPVGTAKGVLVLIVQNAATPDQTTAVTYGGQSLTEVGEFADTTEPGTVTAWFLGTGLPTGGQTVQITRSSTATYFAAALTVTAGGDTVVVDWDGNITASADNLNTSLDIPATTSAFVAGAVFSGEAATTSITISSATLVTSVDFGQQVGEIDRYNTIVAAGTTAFTGMSWVQSADDAAWIAVAIGRKMPAYHEGDATSSTSPTSAAEAGSVGRASGSADLLLDPARVISGSILYTYLGSPILLNASPTLTATPGNITKTQAATGTTTSPTTAAAGAVTTVYSPGTDPDDAAYRGRTGANPYLRQRQSPYR